MKRNSRKRRSVSPKSSRADPSSRIRCFEQTWISLFESPIHLDSALSKVDRAEKTWLATWLPPFLRRPVTLLRGARIPFGESEPWTLSREALAQWRPVRAFAEQMQRLEPLQIEKALALHGTREDFPPRFLEEFEAPDGLSGCLSSDPSLSIRVNLTRVSREKCLESLRREVANEAIAESSLIAPAGIVFPRFAHVLNTPQFKKGEFEIQDEGSQIMSLFSLWPEIYGQLLSSEAGPIGGPMPENPELLKKPKPRILVDACSGAGGKALALADAQRGMGRIYAYDVSQRKLDALKKRYRNAGWTNLQTLAIREGDEPEQLSKFAKKADVVLVDAPCSGWGVLRRNPDIKWRQQEIDRERLPDLQHRLLETYSHLVRPGGTLVYGVCTFRKDETLEITRRFLSSHAQFELQSQGFLGPGPTDGFFMAALRLKPSQN